MNKIFYLYQIIVRDKSFSFWKFMWNLWKKCIKSNLKNSNDSALYWIFLSLKINTIKIRCFRSVLFELFFEMQLPDVKKVFLSNKEENGSNILLYKRLSYFFITTSYQRKLEKIIYFIQRRNILYTKKILRTSEKAMGSCFCQPKDFFWSVSWIYLPLE